MYYWGQLYLTLEGGKINLGDGGGTHGAARSARLGPIAYPGTAFGAAAVG